MSVDNSNQIKIIGQQVVGYDFLVVNQFCGFSLNLVSDYYHN